MWTACKKRKDITSDLQDEYKRHAEPRHNIREYDIKSENCHSAANAFCRSDFDKINSRVVHNGIVSTRTTER